MVPQLENALLLFWLVLMRGAHSQEPGARLESDRFVVYWNRSNPRFYRGNYQVDVCINDYLDVFCPHYGPSGPRGPSGPLKFSEKFQLFTPFSLGFEFRPGREYYYISPVADETRRHSCLRLKVFVRQTDDCEHGSSLVHEAESEHSNYLEPRDGTSHEFPEKSRRDFSASPRVSAHSLAVSPALVLLAAILSS